MLAQGSNRRRDGDRIHRQPIGAPEGDSRTLAPTEKHISVSGGMSERQAGMEGSHARLIGWQLAAV